MTGTLQEDTHRDPLAGEFEAVAKALLVALVEAGRGRVR